MNVHNIGLLFERAFAFEFIFHWCICVCLSVCAILFHILYFSLYNIVWKLKWIVVRLIAFERNENCSCLWIFCILNKILFDLTLKVLVKWKCVDRVISVRFYKIGSKWCAGHDFEPIYMKLVWNRTLYTTTCHNS
jgi:hypothetical protein